MQLYEPCKQTARVCIASHGLRVMLAHTTQPMQDMRDGHGSSLHILEQLRRSGEHPPLSAVPCLPHCQLLVHLCGGVEAPLAALG